MKLHAGVAQPDDADIGCNRTITVHAGRDYVAVVHTMSACLGGSRPLHDRVPTSLGGA